MTAIPRKGGPLIGFHRGSLHIKVVGLLSAMSSESLTEKGAASRNTQVDS